MHIGIREREMKTEPPQSTAVVYLTRRSCDFAASDLGVRYYRRCPF